MRARGIALIRTRARAWQFVGARTGVARHVETGVVVDPVDQAVLEDRIGARDALRYRQRVAHLARRERVRDVDDAQAVRIPGREDQVLEDRGVVILLGNAPPRLAVRLGGGLRQALVYLVVGDGEGAHHDWRHL